jgi:hypothetical protein
MFIRESYRKEYYEEHKEEEKEKSRIYREAMKNSDEILECNVCKLRKRTSEMRTRTMCKVCKRIRYSDKSKKHEKKYRPRRRELDRERRKNDKCLVLRHNISRDIWRALKRNKGGKHGSSVAKHLSYTIQQLKEHLESQFESWMNWENHGRYDCNKRTWQLDHIVPQSLLPYDSMEHENFQKCWALSNIRPLEARENIIKGNRIKEKQNENT